MALETYPEALDYLFACTDYEKMQHVRYNADTFNLDRMRNLLARLGSPEQTLQSVHIAGTKGKGSTAAMVHALAMQCGLKVGLYTSPHLVDLRERIRVGREDISPEDLRKLVVGARMVIERMKAEGNPPTFFEVLTALAFRHFVDVKVDLAVVEVGLGGRLDATNVLVPDVSIITAISYDHTAQLGDTLESIAAEKAGIIKWRVPLVTQPQAPEVMDVIDDTCLRMGAPLIRVGRDVTYRWEPAMDGDRLGGRLSVQLPAGTAYNDLFIPLMGEHQALNACAAIAAARRVTPLAGKLTPQIVHDALAHVSWPGRMEYLPGRPDVILDGAHNRASVERLAEALAVHFPGVRTVLVFGAAADKDLDGMMAALVEKMPAAAVLFTRTESPRAADPADLAARFAAAGGTTGQVEADLVTALKAAGGLAGPGGLVVVCGSLYLVGDIKRRLAGK